MPTRPFLSVIVAGLAVCGCTVGQTQACEHEGTAVVCNTIVIYLDVPEGGFDAAVDGILTALPESRLKLAQPSVRRVLLELEGSRIDEAISLLQARDEVRSADYLAASSFD